MALFLFLFIQYVIIKFRFDFYLRHRLQIVQTSKDIGLLCLYLHSAFLRESLLIPVQEK